VWKDKERKQKTKRGKRKKLLKLEMNELEIFFYVYKRQKREFKKKKGGSVKKILGVSLTFFSKKFFFLRERRTMNSFSAQYVKSSHSCTIIPFN
jgi:hypothetical protein